MKKVTKDNAEIICFKSDSEGFDYCFTDYSSWEDETKDTKLEPLVKAYQKASEELKEALSELKEEYGIEDS